MTETVRVSGKGQVVIPKDIRDNIGLETGDELTVTLQEGKIVMRKKPANYTKWMRGLHKEAWEGVDAAEYVDKERDDWKPREG
ncbi:MAG: AbrB/MazE/SpoVT family DNA-binding domain-containing protein [Candidatus Bathyarchaeota archaeon]|nr:AbrB/MazE/SpoVT family DNA-binding domain-containing protein [Candidatus Bathyarchaeota archaeon]